MPTDQTAERLPDDATRAVALKAAADAIDAMWRSRTPEDRKCLTPEHFASAALDAAAPLLIEAGKQAALDGTRARRQWVVRPAPGEPPSPLIYPTPEAANAGCVVPGDTVWERVVIETPWQAVPETAGEG